MTGIVSIRGVDGSEWTVIGGVGSIELAPEETPLPRTREELLQYRITSFQTMWREAMEPFAKALTDAAQSINEAMTAMDACMPKPKHQPPFWAHNPTKQKRPRR